MLRRFLLGSLRRFAPAVLANRMRSVVAIGIDIAVVVLSQSERFCGTVLYFDIERTQKHIYKTITLRSMEGRDLERYERKIGKMQQDRFGL